MNNHFETIYNFLSKPFPAKDPDFVLVLGNNDLRVPKFAAQFCLDNNIQHIIISGGFGKITKDTWKVSEAETFAEVMVDRGINPDYLYLEKEATNTGENISKSKSLHKKHNFPSRRGVIITKPYMTRRGYNTANKKWPEVKWAAMGEPLTLHQYLSKIPNEQEFKNLLVGDLQRIKLYAEKGFQIKDEIPDAVWASFSYLADNGYDRFVIK